MQGQAVGWDPCEIHSRHTNWTCLPRGQRSRGVCWAAGAQKPQRLVHTHTPTHTAQSLYCLVCGQPPWTDMGSPDAPTVAQNHSSPAGSRPQLAGWGGDSGVGGEHPPHVLVSETELCSALICGEGGMLSPRKQLPEPSVSRVTDDDFHVSSPGLGDHVHRLHRSLLVKPAVRETPLAGVGGAGHKIGGRDTRLVGGRCDW